MEGSYVGQKRYYTTGGLDTSGVTMPSSSKVGNNMWQAIIPAAAGLVGSLVQGLGNKSAIESTNEMNYRMFKEQNQWNLEQWNRENKYNSPAEQAKRLQAAGINPNYVFGNGSIAEAGRLESASPTPFQAPTMDVDYNAAANNVYTGINAFNQSQLINAQVNELTERAHSLAIQNDLDFVTLNNKIWDSDLSLSEKKEMVDYLWKTHNARVAVAQGSEKLQNENIRNLQESTNYLVAKKNIEQKLADSNIKVNEETIKKISQEVAVLKAEEGKTNAEKALILEQKAGVIIENQMKNIDKDIKEKTKNILVDTAKEELFKLEDERYLRPFELDYQSQGKAGQYYPFPQGQYGASQLYDKNNRRDRLHR